MAKVWQASSSPTGRILRNSRLFSLPQALDSSSMERIVSIGLTQGSEKATQVYPTLQAITTPAASRARGDWGFKRPLPTRRTSRLGNNASVRIYAWDTWERVTEYTSAEDHVQTLRKFQRLNVALSQPYRHHSSPSSSLPQQHAKFISAFDERIDNTYCPYTRLNDSASEPDAIKQVLCKLSTPNFTLTTSPPPLVQLQDAYSTADPTVTTVPVRWKYHGPWLAGLCPRDFSRYVKRNVLPRRSAFQAFLNAYIAHTIWQDANTVRERSHATNLGRQTYDDRGTATTKLAARVLERFTSFDQILNNLLTDELLRHMFTQRRRSLYAQCVHSESTLAVLIRSFFDLPPSEEKSLYISSPSSSPHRPAFRLSTQDSPLLHDSTTRQQSRLSGFPLSTHASMGLSYLLSNATLTNNALIGPLATLPCTLARILTPASLTPDRRGRLGVAGFVVTPQTIAAPASPRSIIFPAIIDSGLGSHEADDATASTSPACSPEHDKFTNNWSSQAHHAPRFLEFDAFHRLDVNLADGAKLWVNPTGPAWVTTFARLMLNVQPTPESTWKVQEYVQRTTSSVRFPVNSQQTSTIATRRHKASFDELEHPLNAQLRQMRKSRKTFVSSLASLPSS